MSGTEELAAMEEFRILLHRIGSQLTPQNCHGLKFLTNYRKATTEQNILGLDILDEQLSRDSITPVKLDKLEKWLTEINRMDLLDLIKEYKKSSEFKSAQKLENNKKIKKRFASRPQHNDNALLPGTLMTVVHLNCHIWNLVDITTSMKTLSKKEVNAMNDVKRDHERFRKSLKTAIAVITEKNSIEEREIISGKNLTRAPKFLPPSSHGLSISTPNLASQ